MEPIFEMEGVGGDTMRVILECYRAVEAPGHEQYQAVPKARDRLYCQNADVQYFQRIKQKNHYNYHKSNIDGNTAIVDKIQSKNGHFDPFNRQELLNRLKTFTVMNWNVPSSICGEMNELKCARNGWKCISFSMNNNTKNHLICTACNQQLVLKFHADSDIFHHQDSYSFVDGDDEFDEEFNAKLAKLYLQQVVCDGHAVDCCWRQLETTLENLYYPRPYVEASDEVLILDYLHTFKNLLDNHVVLSDYGDSFVDSFTSHVPEEKFIVNTNTWLLSKYPDNKENFSVVLQYIPKWYYRLAMLGWSLNIQTFDKQVVLLLICSKCNQRVFLNSTHVNNVSIGLDLSTSKVLTPCVNPITLNVADEETVDRFNPYTEHKPWCCNINHMNSLSEQIYFYDYFETMVAKSTKVLRADGLFSLDDMLIDFNAPVKRRASFDINEGMERLHKLRKFYLKEE